MKKLLFIIVSLFFFVTVACAQKSRQFKKFKGDAAVGYALFNNNNGELALNRGFIFALEPRFAVKDNFTVGLRIETIYLGKNTSSTTTGVLIPDNYTLKLYGGFVATADYYFNNNYSIRPFAGAGAGYYYTTTQSDLFEDATVITEDTKCGGMIRAGAEIKHLRLVAEYNMVPSCTITYRNKTGVIVNEESHNSYFSLKVGFCFGGGPRK